MKIFTVQYKRGNEIYSKQVVARSFAKAEEVFEKYAKRSGIYYAHITNIELIQSETPVQK